jgi:hypothetical protein
MYLSYFRNKLVYTYCIYTFVPYFLRILQFSALKLCKLNLKVRLRLRLGSFDLRFRSLAYFTLIFKILTGFGSDSIVDSGD